MFWSRRQSLRNKIEIFAIVGMSKLEELHSTRCKKGHYVDKPLSQMTLTVGQDEYLYSRDTDTSPNSAF